MTRIGSMIGRPQDQRATLLGLGLPRTHAQKVLEKTPSVMGMIRKVRHLVRWEDVRNEP
ncbi:MAG: 50S ribosomal protein L30 [Pseudomonadota bacterium]